MRSGIRLASAAAAAALLLAGCGSDSGSGSASDPTGSAAPSSEAPSSEAPSSAADSGGKDVKVGLVFDVGGKGDKSFNDGADAGLQKAVTEFGVQQKELSPNAGGTDREELLRLVASSGYNPVIGVGFSFADAVTKVAKEFPQTTFAVIDATSTQTNVAGLTFAAEQASYLVGAAAALKSKTHHVGYIGGVSVPLLQAFQAGFDAGAKKADPSVKLETKYLTNPPDLSGFNAPDKGKEAANGMYDKGADIVYAAAGGSGSGVFQAAAAQKAFAIGVDGDQYLSADPAVKSTIITSALKRVDVAVYDFIKAFVDGDKWTGEHHFDLKNDGVGYSTSNSAIDDVKAKLDAYKAQIISGAIKIPTKPGQ